MKFGFNHVTAPNILEEMVTRGIMVRIGDTRTYTGSVSREELEQHIYNECRPLKPKPKTPKLRDESYAQEMIYFKYATMVYEWMLRNYNRKRIKLDYILSELNAPIYEPGTTWEMWVLVDIIKRDFPLLKVTEKEGYYLNIYKNYKELELKYSFIVEHTHNNRKLTFLKCGEWWVLGILSLEDQNKRHCWIHNDDMPILRHLLNKKEFWPEFAKEIISA